MRDVILTRCSSSALLDRDVPVEMRDELLEAAVAAPCHHKTNPHRFVVLLGDARNEFGDFLAQRLAGRLDPELPEWAREALLAKERAKPLRAPVVIVAGVADGTGHPKSLPLEQTATVAAGIQNLLLLAYASGRAAKWRTGDIAYDPAVMEWLALQGVTHIAGFIDLGWPSEPVVAGVRPKPSVVWRGVG